MTDIAKQSAGELKMIEISPGKQSTDIHIGSYLGYLVGNYTSGINKQEGKVVIVSKDTDYDHVIEFWKKEKGIQVSRVDQIKGNKDNSNISSNKNTKNVVKVDGNKKTTLNQEIMKAVREAGLEAKEVNEIAQMVTGHYGEERFLNAVHNDLRKKHTNYLKIYKAIKPVLNKYDEYSTVSVQPDKSAKNIQIQQILSKSNFPEDVINYVASVVTNNTGIKNEKQQIYRTIISKYGQAKGLNIYNHIKKHI